MYSLSENWFTLTGVNVKVCATLGETLLDLLTKDLIFSALSNAFWALDFHVSFSFSAATALTEFDGALRLRWRKSSADLT